MSEMERKAPDSREQGERKVSHPTGGRGGAGGGCLWLRGEAGAGRGSPTTPGQGPSAPWQGGPRSGCGCLLGPLCLLCPLPLHSLWPCPSASMARTEQALGDSPSGTVPQGHLAPQRCSMAVPFALSPPACMLCGRVDADPNICGPRCERNGLCAHVLCLVSSRGSCQHPTRDDPFLYDP